jgi:chemotaxis response regulator CheB
MSLKKVRVLVVDDSALMRKLIPQMLEADPSIEVVGTAMDGNFCLKKIEELQPNVITLDLQMPGMNGIDTLKEIMRRHPLPVIVVSSHSTEGASITFKALGLGAFDFVTKPQDASVHMAETARELIAKIKAAADCKVVRPGTLRGAPPRPEKIGPRNLAYPYPDCRHRNLHRRAASSRVLVGATSAGFSGNHSGGATHAVGLYRNVCPPSRRVVRSAGEGSPIGRRAAGGTRGDLPRKPAHDGKAAAHGRRCGAQ